MCLNQEEVWTGAVYQGIDYGWRFEASTKGRLRNTKTKRVYAACCSNDGYLQSCISVYGKRISVHVHRCIAESFLSNPNGYEIVNHLDGNKHNNEVDNLEWCSRHDNYIHAVEMELINYDIPVRLGYYSGAGVYAGSWNGMSKLSEADVLYIRSVYIPKGKGERGNRKELAELFGVSPNLVSKIVSRAIWTHI